MSSITNNITLPTKITTENESILNDEVSILKETVKNLQKDMKSLSEDTNNKIELENNKTNKKMECMNKNLENKMNELEVTIGNNIKFDMKAMFADMTLSIKKSIKKESGKTNKRLEQEEQKYDNSQNGYGKTTKDRCTSNSTVITRSKTAKTVENCDMSDMDEESDDEDIMGNNDEENKNMGGVGTSFDN
jgi:hypothetical protein